MKELVNRLINGEKNAWKEFVEQYANFCYTVVKNTMRGFSSVVLEHDVEDAVSDTFASLLKDNYRALRNLRAPSKKSASL